MGETDKMGLLASKASSTIERKESTIALLHWGDRIEDFLDTIGISFDTFCNELTGGWMFGYIEALRQVGVRTVLFCISAEVTEPTRRYHKLTGATICLLPVPRLHHHVRRPMKNPYGWSLDEVFGKAPKIRRPLYKFFRNVAPYLATPLGLLAHELQQEHCQAILCQEYEYARFDLCVLLGKWLNIPVFATFQGGNFQLSEFECLLRPLTLRACTGLIIASQNETQRVQTQYRVPPDKIARIFNPMDVITWQKFDRLECREAIGIEPDAEVVVYHGRIEIYRKGLDILLDAWALVCQLRTHRNLKLLIVGTGSDSSKLHQSIAERQLHNVLWIDEYVRDRRLMQQYLSTADLYTLSSRNEGFPVAPLEAMACGLPVVATDAPGMSDILESGEDSGGIVVPREDADALAQAIGQVLDDEKLRYKLSKNARERVESTFSLKTIGKELHNFLLSKD